VEVEEKQSKQLLRRCRTIMKIRNTYENAIDVLHKL